MDDEAILAGLDENPDAFGHFYRRHAAALLEYFLDRTYDRRMAAELCAETFAAALDGARRFDRGQVPAEEWLYEHARSLLEDARSRGVADGRARRRLGLPELTVGERFLDELEEELVEAARFRAERHRRAERRPALPRPPTRTLLVGVALLAAVAGAALLLGGDDRERAAAGGPATATPVDGCSRGVTSALLSRFPVLRREAQPGFTLPEAAIDALSESEPRIRAIAGDRARYWGGDEGVDFWAVPVVASNTRVCAPADRACVVAVVATGGAYPACGLVERDKSLAWTVAQIMPQRTVIWGVVPPGVTGALVTIGGSTATAEAGAGVVGDVLPFPYGNEKKVRFEMTRGPVGAPVVGVVDASGIPGVAENKRAVLREAGYATVPARDAAPETQARTVVRWWPGNGARFHAVRLARTLRARARRIRPAGSPGWLLAMRTPVVLVVGSEP